MATLTKEFREALAADEEEGLLAEHARWLVDFYYSTQDLRIRAANQQRAVEQEVDARPLEITRFTFEQMELIEKEIAKTLDAYSDAMPGSWAKTQYGIGPIIAAGLMAHIDIDRAPTVGHIWRFAGLDPTVKWEKGQKRPWNADLKVLCWKIGDSFVKFSNQPKCVYGHVYRERKAYEVAKNLAGDYADQAARSLVERKIRDKGLRECYEAGRLPDGRIDQRARRYAVKLFLAHYHEIAYRDRFGVDPPLPYAIQHLGHVHKIDPPNPEK